MFGCPGGGTKPGIWIFSTAVVAADDKGVSEELCGVFGRVIPR